MIHLTPADYVRQPWKNGRGVTVELWRLEVKGRLTVRLSRASVVEDGPFSTFPGMERNLTVLSGAGFRLEGEGLDLRCAPLVPVAFPGDVALTARDTNGGPSEDFNVMTARQLPKPEVTVVKDAHLPAGRLLAIYALGAATVNGQAIGPEHLVITEDTVRLISDQPTLAIRFHGLPRL